MNQLLQSLKTGDLSLIQIPQPQVKDNHLLVQATSSLISAGTERMLMDFGRANIVGKIKQQPDKVKQVFNKIKTDGVVATLEAVRAKLDHPIPLGYCLVGKIVESGQGCGDFKIGERVVTNGYHAEVVRVSKNLCVKIPDNVDDESATFAVLGAIGLQGIRLANPTLGETFVVIGLGLIGHLTVQLLIAQGCRVLGIDFDASRCALAHRFGAEVLQLSEDVDPISFADQFSRRRGVDGVLITAATESDLPIKQAALMCRKRGRIVLIGVAGLHLSRDDFYKKELSFQVSCSYGPGRYDKNYEEKGLDYPIGFVRWTENRNIEAVLDMMAAGKINVAPLITHRFIFSEAIGAYKLLDDKSALGILLKYSENPTSSAHRPLFSKEVALNPPGAAHRPLFSKGVVLACAGAGNFSSRVLLPLFKKHNAQLHTLVSNQGINAVIHGKKNGFSYASSDFNDVLKNNEINTVIIATPHCLHADQVVACLQAGKHVFVEKPLAITHEQLLKIAEEYGSGSDSDRSIRKKPILMIGFNRRFSPFIQKIKNLLTPLHEPKNMIMTVNAGFIPRDHWTQDSKIGGGRLLGEACHFIDLLRYIADAPIAKSDIHRLNSDRYCKNENITITLEFMDGSLGTVHYFANGHAGFPKETLDVFCAGKILHLDNFRKLSGFGFTNFKKMKTFRQQKGHAEEIAEFIKAIENNSGAPIFFDEILEVTEVCLKLN